MQSHKVDVKGKRIMFVEEIRQRSRHSLINQKRQLLRQDTQCHDFVQQLPDSLDLLHSLYSNFPDLEGYAADCFLRWCPGKPLSIHNTIQYLHWGSLLSICLEHCPHFPFQHFFPYCCALEDYQTKNNPNQNVLPIILSLCIQHQSSWMADLDPLCQKQLHADWNINKQFLHFLLAGFIKKLNFTQKCLKQDSFLKKLIEALTDHIDQLDIVALVVKLLVIITFYDDGHVSEKLAQLELIRSIHFLLDFMESPHHSLILNLCFLVANICENIGSATLIEEQFLVTLSALGRSENHSPQVTREASRVYLIILKNMAGTQSELSNVGDIDGAQKAVELIDTLGLNPNSDDLLFYGEQALMNFIRIGEELKECQELTVNPFILKLEHCGVSELIRRSPLSFDNIRIHFH